MLDVVDSAGAAESLAMDLVSDMVLVVSDGIVTYANRSCLDALGRRAHQVVDKPLAQIIHPDMRPLLDLALQTLAQGQGPLHLKLCHAHGAEVDVEVVGVPLSGQDPNSLLLRGRDVGQTARWAETLAESEARYRRVVDLTMDMVSIWTEGRLTFVNLAGERMLGARCSSQLVGLELADLVHSDWLPAVSAGLEALAAEAYPVPLKLRRLDGGTLDVEISVRPFGGADDGGPGSFVMDARDVTAERQAARSLREREQRLRGIMESVAEGIITTDEDGVIASFNPAAERIFGWPASEAVGQFIGIILSDCDRFLAAEGGVRETQGRRRDGAIVPLELNVARSRRERDQQLIGIVRDISERKRAEEKLGMAATILGTILEGIAVLDSTLRLQSVNAAFTAITGYGPADAIGAPLSLVAGCLADTQQRQRLWERLDRTGGWSTECWCSRADGSRYAAQLTVTPLPGPGPALDRLVLVVADITQRKLDEERIRHQASYDGLTDLPNRTQFFHTLDQVLAAATRRGRKGALLFLDLDGFKTVNDSLGHLAGDHVLTVVAERIKACVRRDEMVARLGGDEFTVILPEVENPHEAGALARRLIDELEKPVDVEGFQVALSATVGIALFPDDARDVNSLVSAADAALYRSKDLGRGSFHFFTADMNDAHRERLAIKKGLAMALERGEFRLVYQPKVDLKTGLITGCEALLRWLSPELGLVPPVKFIPVLEETNLINPVGEWVIEAACRQHRLWQAKGLPPIRIAVNLSVRQLRDTLPQWVADALSRAQVPPEGLELELTESLVMRDPEQAAPLLGQLAEMGVHLAMDDFGTGYSSLSYLKKLPLHTIKIDRSFVMDMMDDGDDAEITKTIITMGHSLRRHVVAEGVETTAQCNMLKRFRCDTIQGYLFSPPVPPEKFEALLAAPPLIPGLTSPGKG